MEITEEMLDVIEAVRVDVTLPIGIIVVKDIWKTKKI